MSVSTQPATDESTTSRLTVLRNGLVGGVVAILLSFLPLSTVIGGGVAGYLEAPRATASAGAIAGAIGILPHAVIGGYLIHSPNFVPPGPDIGLSPELTILGLLGVGVIYAVGLGILGGLGGSYLRTEIVEP